MMNPTPSTTERRARAGAPWAPLAAALCLGALPALGGCNIAGPIVAVVAGPDDVPALYRLPAKRATVVFIDDRASRVATRGARELIGTTAEKALLDSGAAKDMIDSRQVLSTLRGERYGEPMTIADVGRAVRAQVVIYARVDRWTLSPDGQTYAPEADLSVKVIDAAADQRLWPTSTTDQPEGSVAFTVRVPAQSVTPPAGTAAVAEAHLDLARWVGLRLAQLFYDHGLREAPEKFTATDRSRG